MSSRSAKAVLLACLFIQCVLWSRSRYAQLPYEVQLRYSPSTALAKRDLSGTSTLKDTQVLVARLLNTSSPQCQPLKHLTSSQCIHVREECPVSDTVLSIPYLQIYFCTQPNLRSLVFTALVLWLFFLFSTLGISASDFFTPNLATIAQFLGLDENVAGVTFLAFGNASPDVFSTFSAMRADSGSLAIGELLGAASFIVSCVVGAMCIIRPFRVNRFPFLRDVGFFTLAVALLLFILQDGHIQAWESGMLVVLYVGYACAVVVGSWWENRMERRRQLEALARAEYDNESLILPYTDEEPYHDDVPPPTMSTSETLTVPQASPPSVRRSVSSPNQPRIAIQTQLDPRPRSRTPSPINTPAHLTQMPSFSLVGALEFRDVIASLQNQAAGSSLNIFDSPMTPYAGGHYHHRRRHSGSRTPPSFTGADPEVDPWDAALGVPLNDRSPRLLRSSITEERERGDSAPPDLLDDGTASRSPFSPRTVPSISHTPASPDGSDASTDVERYVPLTKTQWLYYVIARTCYILFPSLHRFGSKGFLGKIASLFAAPAVMALTLTLPVVVIPYGSDVNQEEKRKRHYHAGGHDTPLVDFEEEGVERTLMAEEAVQEDLHEMKYNKWLMAAQCVLGPLFCVAVLFSGVERIEWFLAGTAIGGVAIGLLVVVFSDEKAHPTAQMARCSMGFLVAIVWIMAIADEVVNVLQAFGFIFGLSDAIIGLTIFAMGNSLADLVANTSVASFAPIMGFSACFGGPLVNILLGVGMSGSYIISASGHAYSLHFTPTLKSSALGLLVLLLVTLVVVPFNGYFLSRSWGIFLIFAYVLLMVVNLVVELSH
ncbi:hypothetical protein ID866_8599 [Astraeus odoratus]|nr:hypothetical protein ID866_8599 [Astraeus odoratus]